MPRGVKKEHLPVKTCVVCHRPFTWRKKWEQVWDQVTTCSKSCNRTRRAQNQIKNRSQSQFQAIIPNEQCNHDNNNHDEEEQHNLPDTTVQDTDEAESLDSCRSNAPVDQMTLVPTDDHDDDCDHHEDDGDATDRSDSESMSTGSGNSTMRNSKLDRKAAKKRAKAERRAKRQDPTHGQKNCHVCGKSVDLLIRCTTDPSQQWKMVCGKCWNKVSGGVVDGDAEHPHYRYGGLWKNRAKR